MSDSTSDTESDVDAAQQPVTGHIILLILALLDPAQRWPLMRRAARLLLVTSLLGFTMALPIWIGQMFAIGVRATVRQEIEAICMTLVAGPAFVSGLFATIWAFQGLFWLLSLGCGCVFDRLPDTFRSHIVGVLRLGKGLAPLILIGVTALYCGRKSYREALETEPSPMTAADQQTIAATRDAAAKQEQAIKQFSATAGTLLRDLDHTATKVAETKREIAQTMVLFDRQLEETRIAQNNLSQLQEKQRQIQSRAEELDRILQGKRPITLEDLDRSGRESLHQGIWTGLLFGVLSSLLASFIYPRLGSLLLGIVRWKKGEGDDS